MMNFELSPALRAHQDAIKKWGRDVAWSHALEADRLHAVPPNGADILNTCPVPLERIDIETPPMPSYPDGDDIRHLALLEAVTYADPWVFEAMNRGMGHLVVKEIGTPEQIRRWHDPIMLAGGGCTGLGMTEPGGGSDNASMMTTAKRVGDQWVLNGAKMYTSRAAASEYIVVLASVDRSLKHAGIRAFVVERDRPGLIITKANEDKLGLKSWMTSALTLEQCSVPLDHELGWDGTEGGGHGPATFSRLLGAFNETRPHVAMQAIGIAQAAVDYARIQFTDVADGFTVERRNQILREFEQMDCTIARGRNLAYLSAWTFYQARGSAGRLEAAMAKAFTPPNAENVIRRCMQIFGPLGVREGCLLEKWHRDIKILDIFEGTAQIMRVLVSRHLMGNATRV